MEAGAAGLWSFGSLSTWGLIKEEADGEGEGSVAGRASSGGS